MSTREPEPSDTSNQAAPRSVFTVLRGRILSGEIAEGQRLPSERDLADEFGVNRSNVRLAVTRLEDEGFLRREPNCRPVVQRPSKSTSRSVALVMWHGEGPNEGTHSTQQTTFWGAIQALGSADYRAVLLNLGDTVGSEEENAVREAANLRYVLNGDFAGALFFPVAYRSNHDLIREVARKTPLVLLDRALVGIEADFVGSANMAATRDAVESLIAMGHTRIAYVTAAESINPVQDRLLGYLAAIRQSSPRLTFEAVLTIPSDANLPWPTFDALLRLADDHRPTAILCVNDHAAVRVAAHLAALGLRVGADVSLVGVDNEVRTLPDGVGLASIAQPFKDIGRTAVELLLRRIENPTVDPVTIELPTAFIVRDSIRHL